VGSTTFHGWLSQELILLFGRFRLTTDNLVKSEMCRKYRHWFIYPILYQGKYQIMLLKMKIRHTQHRFSGYKPDSLLQPTRTLMLDVYKYGLFSPFKFPGMANVLKQRKALIFAKQVRHITA